MQGVRFGHLPHDGGRVAVGLQSLQDHHAGGVEDKGMSGRRVESHPLRADRQLRQTSHGQSPESENLGVFSRIVSSRRPESGREKTPTRETGYSRIFYRQ